MLPSLKLRSCDMTTPWKINGWNIIIGVWFWSFSLQKWVICMFQSVIFQIVSFTPKTSPRLPTRTAPELVHAKEAGEAEAKDHENTQETRQAHLQNKGRQAGKPGNSVVGEGLVNQLVYIYMPMSSNESTTVSTKIYDSAVRYSCRFTKCFTWGRYSSFKVGGMMLWMNNDKQGPMPGMVWGVQPFLTKPFQQFAML